MAVVGGRQGVVIKDPFQTLSQQFLPRDIKKCFEISEKIYKTNITIFRAIYKLAEYPITPLKYTAVKPIDADESKDNDMVLSGDALEKRYEEIFEDSIDINRSLIELNLNYYLYSNDFPMLHLPFERKAVCKECLKKARAKISKGSDRLSLIKKAKEGLTQDIEDLNELKWTKGKFKAKCKKCGDKQRTYDVWDESDRTNFRDVNIGRLNIYQVEIQQLEFSGKRRYLYSPSDITKKKIQSNDLFTLQNEPMIVLNAVEKKNKIEYNASDVFHFRMPSPIFQNSSPWAWPLLISAFQTIFFIAIMRRGAEAIAYEHINPKHFIAPSKEIDSLLTQYNMGDIKNQMLEAYNEAQKDDGQVTAIPFPVTTGIMNQQGRAFLPQAEITQATTEVLNGIGLAEGLVSGQGPFNSNSIAIRILENGCLSQRDMTQRFITYAQKKIQYHYNLGPCEISMTDFRKLDDSLVKQMVSDQVDKKRISSRSFLKTIGYDSQEEADIVEKETIRETKFQAKMEALLEGERAEMQVKNEAIQAAKMTERQMDELKKQTDAVAGMVTDMENKGYDRKLTMDYVAQFMAQQTYAMEVKTIEARRLEAQETFMLGRRASATHSLNRGENKLQEHEMMDQTMNDPALQTAENEDAVIGGIVRRAKIMKSDELNSYLDEIYRRDAVLHQRIVQRLQQEGVPYEGVQ